MKVFHPAPDRSVRANLVRTAVQSTAIWTATLVVVPAVIHSFESSVLPEWPVPSRPVLGSLLFVIASALGIRSGWVMATAGRGTPLPTDCAQRLVIAGPYRYTRNPMAIAGIAQGIGVALFLGSPLVLLYALSGAVFWNVIVRPREESDLLERFGSEYAAYRDRVPCWRMVRR